MLGFGGEEGTPKQDKGSKETARVQDRLDRYAGLILEQSAAIQALNKEVTSLKTEKVGLSPVKILNDRLKDQKEAQKSAETIAISAPTTNQNINNNNENFTLPTSQRHSESTFNAMTAEQSTFIGN